MLKKLIRKIKLHRLRKLNNYLLDVLEASPSVVVESEPVRHGRWCFEEYPDGYYHWECSECEKWFQEDSMKIDEEWNYCPNCGAKMDGKRREDDTDGSD